VTRRAPASQRGSGTVLVLAVVVLLVTITVAVSVLAGVLAARHRAGRAADLAALSGAASLWTSAATVCRSAAAVAAANGARLVGCTVAGDAVLVRVAVTPDGWGRRVGPVQRSARAGPA
jgi:secretion/DNA translocation related TadE-like protein